MSGARVTPADAAAADAAAKTVEYTSKVSNPNITVWDAQQWAAPIGRRWILQALKVSAATGPGQYGFFSPSVDACKCVLSSANSWAPLTGEKDARTVTTLHSSTLLTNPASKRIRSRYKFILEIPGLSATSCHTQCPTGFTYRR